MANVFTLSQTVVTVTAGSSLDEARAGLPAISVLCGFLSTELPIDMQITGREGGEATLFSLAHAYEQVTDWHNRNPPIDLS